MKDEEAAVDDVSGAATRQQRPQPDNTGMQRQQDSTSKSTTEPVTPLSSRSADDVSKEELMDILSKMNKRMKALNVARLQLQEKYSKAEHDNARLMSLLKEEVLTEGDLMDAAHQYEANNTGTYHIACYIAGCMYRMGCIASFIGYDLWE